MGYGMRSNSTVSVIETQKIKRLFAWSPRQLENNKWVWFRYYYNIVRLIKNEEHYNTYRLDRWENIVVCNLNEEDFLMEKLKGNILEEGERLRYDLPD